MDFLDDYKEYDPNHKPESISGEKVREYDPRFSDEILFHKKATFLLLHYSIHENQYEGFYTVHDRELGTCNDARCKNLRRSLMSDFEKAFPERVPMISNMSYSEYMQAFNNDEMVFEEYKKLVFLNEKPPSAERSLDELKDYIILLQKFRNALSVIISKKSIELEDGLESANKETRERIRAKDKTYIRDTSRDDRSNRPMNENKIEDKMMKTMLDLGVKKVKMDEFIIGFRAKKWKSFNEFMITQDKAELFD